MKEEDFRLLVYNIPEKMFGEGVVPLFSPDEQDVDHDICIFSIRSQSYRKAFRDSRSRQTMVLHDRRSKRADVSL